MEFLDRELEKYVETHSDSESPLLHKINRETNLQVNMPRMISGHLQGRVLAMLSQMIRPKKILEIGTYTGYSALCLAEGLQKEGKLITIDVNKELEKRVRGYFEESDYASQIEYIIADATEEIKKVDGPIDLVFIDADKKNYKHYYEGVFDRVREGGFLIIDNVLWSGKVLEEGKKDGSTKAIQEFNTLVHHDKRVENVLFPIRDGLMILRKLATKGTEGLNGQ